MARPPIPKSPAPPSALNDPVRNPPSADSLRLGTTVAVIAHVGLIAALAYGVAWKRQEIATVTAELWSAVPQQAAPAAPPPAPAPQVKAEPVPPPPAPEPPAPAVKPPPPPPPAPAPKVVEPTPPAPRDADIAREKADKRRREAEAEAEQAEQEKKLAKLEQAKRDKAEKAEKAEKAAKEKEKEREREREREKAEKQAALKKEAERKAADKAAAAEKAMEAAKDAAQQEKTAKAREDNLKRLQKQLGEGSDDAAPPSPSRAPAGTGAGGGNAAQASGPSAGYAGRLRAYLKPKLVYTGRNIGSTPAVVRVRVAPDGTIMSRELIKSSGQADWDQAVLDAIDRAGIVPRDIDNRVPPVIDIPWTASER